jgi:hypothetical protein
MTSEGANNEREQDGEGESSSMEDKFSFAQITLRSGAVRDSTQVLVLLLRVRMQYLTTACILQTLQALKVQPKKQALWFLAVLQLRQHQPAHRQMCLEQMHSNKMTAAAWATGRARNHHCCKPWTLAR